MPVDLLRLNSFEFAGLRGHSQTDARRLDRYIVRNLNGQPDTHADTLCTVLRSDFFTILYLGLD